MKPVERITLWLLILALSFQVVHVSIEMARLVEDSNVNNLYFYKKIVELEREK